MQNSELLFFRLPDNMQKVHKLQMPDYTCVLCHRKQFRHSLLTSIDRHTVRQNRNP